MLNLTMTLKLMMCLASVMLILRFVHQVMNFLNCTCALATKTMGIADLNIRTVQISEVFYFNLCNCITWGQTDSDTVSSNVYIYVKIMQFRDGCNGIVFFE